MGLFLAKEYIKSEHSSDIPLQYKNKLLYLRKNERFFCVDDDFIELMYTGDEIKITYGNRDRLVFNNISGVLIFTVIKGLEESTDKQHITYPLTMPFSSVSIMTYTEEEYENSRDKIMSRYLEYRD
jgi:hypothetical protein